jgi:hypothetical protein
MAKRKHQERKAAAGDDGEVTAKFPRHSVSAALRIPKAILEQHAGKDCSDREAIQFAGLSFNGPARVELSSAIKYGFLERPSTGHVHVTELAKKILRPKTKEDEIAGYRAAILKAPNFSEVYKHYRGENLPDNQFFDNSLTDTFKIPQAKLSEFKQLFLESLKKANLSEDHDGKVRIIDISHQAPDVGKPTEEAVTVGQKPIASTTDTCFVMMPFVQPLGNHYSLIFEPAIIKAGLKPVRADDDIFATGKIIDQVWRGIHAAKILVAEWIEIRMSFTNWD